MYSSEYTKTRTSYKIAYECTGDALNIFLTSLAISVLYVTACILYSTKSLTKK